MTGIAEAGRGEYCFLKNAQVIPGLVSKSVHGLLSLVGTDARIVFRGLNGAVVTKIYGHDEDAAAGGGGGGENPMLDGVPLGDLHASNVRQILVELELAPASGSMDGEEAKGDEDGDAGGGGGGAAAMLLGKPVLEYTLEYAAAVSKEEERNELLSALLSAAEVEVVESGPGGGKAGGAAVKDTSAMEAAVVKAMQDLTAAISSGHLRGFEKAAVVGTVKEARGKLDAAGCHWSAALAKTFQLLVKTVNDPTRDPLRDPLSGQGEAAGDGDAPPSVPKLAKQKSSSGRPMLTINGTMRLEGTDDRETMRAPGHPAVEAAYALQVAAQGDEEVVARLDAGDLAAAMFAKGKVVEVLSDALRRMDGVGGMDGVEGEGEGGGGGGGEGGEGGDGGNAEGKYGGTDGDVVVGGGGKGGVDQNRRMVETALIKARKLLENMQNDRDIRSSRLENFEGCRLNRAMSARALSDRADSDDGRAYSDADSDEDNRFDGFRYDDDGNDTDDGSDFGSDDGSGGGGGGGGGVPRSLGLRRALT